MSIRKLGMGTLVAILAIGVASAAIEFDQDATPDVIFGSGNDNGSFTTDRANGVELALRGKLRFNGAGLPENTFNSNGDGTYSFAPGAAVGGAGWVAATTPVWNFEWSVNSDYLNDPLASPPIPLDNWTYEIGLDFDPGKCTTNFLAFDHIIPNTPPANAPFWDHAIGDNLFGNGGGVVAPDAVTYALFLNAGNVAQNSWNYEFFNDAPFDTFDPTVDGTYDIYLKAFDPASGLELASVTIQIIVGTGGPDCVAACCANGPGVASDCIETTQVGCEADGGLYLGDDVFCVDVDDCVPLVVELDSISATQSNEGVALRWTTALEIDTVGFRVLRETGGREKGRVVVGDFIPAVGFGTSGASYEVIDTDMKGRSDGRYFLVDVDLFGRETLHGPIAIQPGGTRTKPVRTGAR